MATMGNKHVENPGFRFILMYFLLPFFPNQTFTNHMI
jgi:hypothetical protein